MKTYKRFRYPSEIISHAVWLHHQFRLSFRDVEELWQQEASLFPMKLLGGGA
jgi:transposase-like protein